MNDIITGIKVASINSLTLPWMAIIIQTIAHNIRGWLFSVLTLPFSLSLRVPYITPGQGVGKWKRLTQNTDRPTLPTTHRSYRTCTQKVHPLFKQSWQ